MLESLENKIIIFKKHIFLHLFDKDKILLRYIISGGLGVLGNLFVFYVATEIFHIWYLLSAVFAFFVALIISFILHKTWTFVGASMGTTKRQGFLYLSSAVGVLVLNSAMLYVLVDLFHIRAIFAQIVTLGLLAVGSFVFTTKVTFKKEDPNKTEVEAPIVKKHGFFGQNIVSSHRLFVILLILIASVNILVRTEFLDFSFNYDGVQYVQTAQLFAGEEVPAHPNRILKPLAPLGMLLFLPFTDSYIAALALESVVFYYFLAILIYFFVFLIVPNKKQAFVASVLFITSYPMLRYGLDLYTETGAWFFYVLGLYGAVLFYKTLSNKAFFLSLAAITLGVLWKEYAILAGVALATITVFHPQLDIRSKIKKIIFAMLVFLPPVLLIMAYVYHQYDYSYLDWYRQGTVVSEEVSQYNIFYISKSLFALFMAGWLFVFLGLRKWKTFSKDQKFIIGSMVIPSFGFFLWGFVSSRLYYVLAVLLAVFAAKGVGTIKRNLYIGILLFLMVAVNYAWLFASYDSGIRTLLNSF